MDDAYTVASGDSLYAGWPRPAPEYAWATGLPSNTWVQLSSMSRFYDWANQPLASGGLAQSGYRGTNSLNSIINAYCDPAYDQTGEAAYYYGGGHGDGTCDALTKSNLRDLTWSRAADPTPPSVYLPQYLNTTAQIDYPSGVTFSGRTFQLPTFFLDASRLDPVLDAGYIAPKLSRASTHMYAAAVYRPASKTVHYFYNGYGEVNVDTGLWTGVDVNLEGQIKALQANLATTQNVWGVSAIYDAVTDRAYFMVTGGGFRNHVAQFNCTTRQVEAVYQCNVGVTMVNASAWVQVGRKLYVFCNVGSYPLFTQPGGAIFDLDAKTFKRFVTVGESIPAIVSGRLAETIPAWYDSGAGKIRRWNYSESLTRIYTMDLTPVGGTGTSGDPFQLAQAGQTVLANPGTFATSAGVPVAYVYSRMLYHAPTGCVLVIPRSDASSHNTGKYLALKLSI